MILVILLFIVIIDISKCGKSMQTYARGCTGIIGPHHAHVWTSLRDGMIGGGYYLHYLQNSIGRGFDMIKKQVKTSLYHVSNGVLTTD